MTLQELRYLVALADTGHFVRAAEACYVGQSTLSTQLKKLEDTLDVTLFVRGKHPLRATPIGERIIEQARTVLSVVDQIKETARRCKDPMSGPLRLGVIPTLGPYLFPQLLPEIRARFPELTIYLREDLTEHLLERLRRGRLDALLLALPVHGTDLETMELFSESFVVALPRGHRLAALRQIAPADLARENLLLLEDGHCMRDQALAICAEHDTARREELEAISIDTLRQMVGQGVGCTLLPQLASRPGAGSLRDSEVLIRPFAPPQPQRTIGLVWRHQFPRKATLRTLAELIRNRLPQEIRITTEKYADRPLPLLDPLVSACGSRAAA